MKITAPLFALSVACFASQPVLAQSAVSADETVDALANIVAPDLTLAIVPQIDLDFGTVNLPNGTNPGALCRYDMVVNTLAARLDVSEVKGGNAVDTTVPTGSGCDSDGSFASAGFVVACTPAATVTFQVTWASAGREGVVLRPGSTGVITSSVGNTLRSVINPSVPTPFACPDGASSVTSPAGELVLRTGGRLEIEETATPFNGLIGTVTLNAMY